VRPLVDTEALINISNSKFFLPLPPLACVARLSQADGSVSVNTYSLPKPIKVSDASGRAVLISLMTNDKVPYVAVLGIEWIHKWCGCAVSDSRKVKFDTCTVVDEKSYKLAVDALAKIKTVFFKDLQNILAHSKHDFEIVLREDIRIPNCRMPCCWLRIGKY
jgi:hypothetical protein